MNECHMDDLDLYILDQDNLKELKTRCLRVRQQMNEAVPEPDKALENLLSVGESTIKGAGNGLIFSPSSDDIQMIEEGTIICYYTGHHHNYHSAQMLHDKSYLMCISGDFLVDAGPCPNIKARYINDPLNDDAVNCKFIPDPEHFRSITVATRTIYAGEEIFASYGDGYWAQQGKEGIVLHK